MNKLIIIDMKAVLFFLCLLVASTVNAQNEKSQDMLKQIEGKYKIDDNGNVTYVKVIEVPSLSKDEIFTRAQNYFTYNYGSGKSVIQTQDKEQGILVGKGLYSKVFVSSVIVTSTYDAWHILRIDAKDGKARVILTLTTYDIEVRGNGIPTHSSGNISDTYPINPKGKSKNLMTKVFYYAHLKAIESLNSVEKAVKEGNTSSEIENDNW